MTAWVVTFLAIFISVLVVAGYRRRANQLVDALREEQRAELRVIEAESDSRIRRLEREAETSRNDTKDSLVRDLLPILDSLDNAILSAQDPATEKGLGLLFDEFVKTLRKQGIDVFHPQSGEAFDPQIHEAVDVVEDMELEPGSVARTLRAGARSRDRVLRPALVAVANALADHDEVVLDLAPEPVSVAD